MIVELYFILQARAPNHCGTHVRMLVHRQRCSTRVTCKIYLVETMGLTHGRLQVQGLDVLPVLLEQGDQEVDGQHDVSNQLVFGHGNVANGDTQAEDLLQLELDGGTDFIGLDLQVIVVGDGSGELADLVKTGTQKTGDLLDQGIGSKESIVLLGELLDKLLVLVELLQVLNRLEFHTGSLGLVAVESITENADGKVGTGNVGKSRVS